MYFWGCSSNRTLFCISRDSRKLSGIVLSNLTPSSSAGYLLGLWGWQEKTIRLLPPLLSLSPHLPAGRAWTALGQQTPPRHTHTWEIGLRGRFRREEKAEKDEERTHHTRDVTRKCKFGVMNSEQGHEKLWIFIKQRRGTAYLWHMGWDEGMKYRNEYVWVPAHMKE